MLLFSIHVINILYLTFLKLKMDILNNRSLHFLFLLIMVVMACQKDPFAGSDADADFGFSNDTVHFDTIFTTFGSTTKSFKVYNQGNDPVTFNEIRLMGGSQSFFRLNINGRDQSEIRDITLRGKDSLYVFVEVTIDGSDENNPIFINDSIVFSANNNTKFVQIEAWGQNVHLYDADVIEEDEVWTNDKPYVIYNNVTIDSNSTLTIEEGVRVHSHFRSSIIVEGRLLVNGTLENPVVFQADRLEEDYEDTPSQWGTIVFFPNSTGNVIKNAVIKNAITGMQVGLLTEYETVEVTLENVVIKNMSFAGIYAFGANITGMNVEISNCTETLMALFRGGEYAFHHCTFGNYKTSAGGSNVLHAGIYLSNYYTFPDYRDPFTGEIFDIHFGGDLLKADFKNSIIYGTNEDELVLADTSLNIYEYRFENCIIKNSGEDIDTTDTERFKNIYWNKDPGFIMITDDSLDLALDSAAFAIDKGNPALLDEIPELRQDILGNSRDSDAAPDPGAYEYMEN